MIEVARAPCTTGWYYLPEMTVEMGRLAVQTWAWPILEVDHGELKVNVKPDELRPVAECLEPQGRFKHVTEEQTQQIQKFTQHDWEMLLQMENTREMPGY